MKYIVFRRSPAGLSYEAWSRHLGDFDRIVWEHKLTPGDVIYSDGYFKVLTHHNAQELVRSCFEYLDELGEKQFTFGGRPWSAQMGDTLLDEARKKGAPV